MCQYKTDETVDLFMLRWVLFRIRDKITSTNPQYTAILLRILYLYRHRYNKFLRIEPGITRVDANLILFFRNRMRTFPKADPELTSVNFLRWSQMLQGFDIIEPRYWCYPWWNMWESKHSLETSLLFKMVLEAKRKMFTVQGSTQSIYFDDLLFTRSYFNVTEEGSPSWPWVLIPRVASRKEGSHRQGRLK